jgi:hypothetical protein
MPAQIKSFPQLVYKFVSYSSKLGAVTAENKHNIKDMNLADSGFTFPRAINSTKIISLDFY